ncbi:hypothetical protein T09_1456 [Trichinella sp. T9]|nr:hypothetical protein T09_1456 [Trichinella sp. T9]
MLVDTWSAVTLANEKFMWGSKTLSDVPKPAIQLETAGRIADHERVCHRDYTWWISDRTAYRFVCKGSFP